MAFIVFNSCYDICTLANAQATWHLENEMHTCVPGQATLRDVGRALVEGILEGFVLIDRGHILIGGSGFLTKLAVLAIGALKTYIHTK